MMAQGILGLVVFLGIAWAMSEQRSAVSAREVAVGMLVQVGLAALLLNVPGSYVFFNGLNQWVLALDEATKAGTGFVFGYVGGGAAPFALENGQHSFILAFQALPVLLVVSALTSVLFYWRVLPYIVLGMAWLLQKSLKVGGALGLATAANVFVGMTEAPLFIRPYLKELTRCELFVLMTTGMATIAGTVLVVYAHILRPVMADSLGHLLIASLISVPAAITIARIMVPETATSTAGRLWPTQRATSTIDAITQGTLEGLQLLLNIVALLLVFVALLHLLNQVLAWIGLVGGEVLTLQRILGWLMAPLAWLMGIPWAQAAQAGSLLGIKTVLNEFLAYLQLAQLSPDTFTEHSRVILLYALCGFANFGSLGIMIGGLGTLVPTRRAEIVALGVKSIIAGTLATCMTGALAGLFYHAT